jgi:hypothetical protein
LRIFGRELRNINVAGRKNGLLSLMIRAERAKKEAPEFTPTTALREE